jgi:hypothetical protein
VLRTARGRPVVGSDGSTGGLTAALAEVATVTPLFLDDVSVLVALRHIRERYGVRRLLVARGTGILKASEPHRRVTPNSFARRCRIGPRLFVA